MDIILLIDDRETMRDTVKASLEEALASAKLTEECRVEIVTSDNHKEYFQVTEDGIFAPEDKLAFCLKSRSDIKLVVVDHDLSRFSTDTLFSEPVVSTACHAASIPQCRYSRTDLTQSKVLADAVESSSLFSVKIDIQRDLEAAKKMVEIYVGFKEINTAISGLDLTVEGVSPSNLLANILNSGDQRSFERYSFSASFLREIIELQSSKKNLEMEFSDLLSKRLGYLLGYWLYNSILQFPGIILNEKATASYLNIDVNDFEKVDALFNSAKYNGPFSLFTNYWWYSKLEVLLEDEDVWKGNELAEKKGIQVLPCLCSANPKIEAGYYCIVTKEPISKEESVGELSWLPDGAIFCRVSRKPYQMIAPLLGLY